MEDEEVSSSKICPVKKFSYATIVTKGIFSDSVSDSVTDSVSISDSDSDFTVVSHARKRDMTKKCENAVFQWANNKGLVPKSEKSCDEIICNRCSSPFVFPSKMKERYVEKGWVAPKICKMCSQIRFEERSKNF